MEARCAPGDSPDSRVIRGWLLWYDLNTLIGGTFLPTIHSVGHHKIQPAQAKFEPTLLDLWISKQILLWNTFGHHNMDIVCTIEGSIVPTDRYGELLQWNQIFDKWFTMDPYVSETPEPKKHIFSH